MAPKKKTKPKGKHGGKRAGSGRNPHPKGKELEAIYDRVEKHGTVKVTYESTAGKILTLTRNEVVLQVFYEKATTGTKDIEAGKAYLDRTLGKARATTQGAGDGTPLVNVNFVGEANARLKGWL